MAHISKRARSHRKYSGADRMLMGKHRYKSVALELLDIIGEDLPDGAYCALAEELGVDWGDVEADAKEDGK